MYLVSHPSQFCRTFGSYFLRTCDATLMRVAWRFSITSYDFGTVSYYWNFDFVYLVAPLSVLHRNFGTYYLRTRDTTLNQLHGDRLLWLEESFVIEISIACIWWLSAVRAVLIYRSLFFAWRDATLMGITRWLLIMTVEKFHHWNFDCSYLVAHFLFLRGLFGAYFSRTCDATLMQFAWLLLL